MNVNDVNAHVNIARLGSKRNNYRYEQIKLLNKFASIVIRKSLIHMTTVTTWQEWRVLVYTCICVSHFDIPSTN